jgi:KDO2-lipid IV(A) lauroyltransferase
MRESLEFAVVYALIKLLGWPPRWWARRMGAAIGLLAFLLLPRLRRVGLRNLEKD